MDVRPELSCELDAETFSSYYYLKEELVNFCRQQSLQATGSKAELTDRIEHYLTTGENKATVHSKAKAVDIGVITKDTVIEFPFVCSEVHRAFFKNAIGKSFTFKVAFQKWLKENSGKTYQDAIEAYAKILDINKNSISTIDKQFEYNTYIRAFFADNKGRTLEDAIRCWKYKKSLQGHNYYEKTDLVAIG